MPAVFRCREAARFRTGWRLEGVLREFKPFSPRYLWFDYPVHKADAEGFLRDLAADGEKHGSIYRAQAARKEKAKEAKLSKREQITNALMLANGGDACTVENLAEYMNAKKDTVRKWIRENGFGIDKTTGIVQDLTDHADATE
jgi:hypothetical protein